MPKDILFLISLSLEKGVGMVFLLNILLSLGDASFIKNIHLARTPCNDRRIWTTTTDGQLTVRSAYLTARKLHGFTLEKSVGFWFGLLKWVQKSKNFFGVFCMAAFLWRILHWLSKSLIVTDPMSSSAVNTSSIHFNVSHQLPL